MRRGQIAWVVFEHRACVGGDARLFKHGLKRHLFRLGLKARMFHAKDRIETAQKPARSNHPFRIRRGAVGVDDLAPRQGVDPGCQCGIPRQVIEGDVMHMRQVRAGIDIMFPHQPRECRAILRPIGAAQFICAITVDLEFAHHPIGHAHLNLIKQPG